MKKILVYRTIQIIAIVLAITYIISFFDFVSTKQINFIGYIAQTTSEIWIIRNLGIRLLAIALGFLIAIKLDNKTLLATMFAVRLTADLGDMINSLVLPGIPSFVWQVLTLFVLTEAICLTGILRIIKDEKQV